MVRKSILSMLIAGALLWPANAARTNTPDQQRTYQANIVKGQQAQDVTVPTVAFRIHYGQVLPHFNPYGPGHFEGPFPREHKHHGHRSFEHRAVR